MKYVVIDKEGNELPPVVFPAMISRAGRGVAGAIARVETVSAGGSQWWVGEDALLAPAPLTLLAQERLSDPAFLPALVRSALQRLGNLNGASSGVCVTGLPATWAADPEKARALGAHLRDASSGYSGIRVIPEPLGLLYAEALDNHGQVAGDPALLEGQVAVVDLGHHTVDVAVLRRLVPAPTGLDTYQLGTSRPLQQIRAHLSAAFERELTLFEADQAVRAQALLIAGQPRSLPSRSRPPMTTPMRLLPVRVSPAVRGLIDQVGPVNPATRALLVLGAAAAGLELRELEREVAGLLSAELAPAIQEALRRLFARLSASSKYVSFSSPVRDEPEPNDDLPLIEDVPDDPFAGMVSAEA